MIKTVRVRAENIKAGDVMIAQLSVHTRQEARIFKQDGSHIYINGMKFDPKETIRVERLYRGNSKKTPHDSGGETEGP